MDRPFTAAFYLMSRLHTVGALTFNCGSRCDERHGSTYDGLCLAYNERAYQDRAAERKARYRRERQHDMRMEWDEARARWIARQSRTTAAMGGV